jgi:hypothetical protein
MKSKTDTLIVKNKIVTRIIKKSEMAEFDCKWNSGKIKNCTYSEAFYSNFRLDGLLAKTKFVKMTESKNRNGEDILNLMFKFR